MNSGVLGYPLSRLNMMLMFIRLDGWLMSIFVNKCITSFLVAAKREEDNLVLLFGRWPA